MANREVWFDAFGVGGGGEGVKGAGESMRSSVICGAGCAGCAGGSCSDEGCFKW